MPAEIEYDIGILADMIKRDEKAVVAFYGGEPTLEVEKMREMMNVLPAKKFVLQTNGFFLERLGEDVNKLDSILLSIDGRKEVTDFYRGKGCYDRVMKALNFLKRKNYKGEIIARMAASVKTDIYEDVMHVLNHFPYVHWQLDAIWSTMWDVDEFWKWAMENYMPGIKKLVRFWIEEMERGKIHGIVPFLGISSRLLHGGDGLPCGAGRDAVSITTDGKILACPIAPEFEWNVLGDLKAYKKIGIGEPCRSCEVYEICGGRCLFAYKERLWGEEGVNKICHITRFTINEIKKYQKLLMHHKENLKYPPYNNTTEIIP